jgi:hypothetical protein
MKKIYLPLLLLVVRVKVFGQTFSITGTAYGQNAQLSGTVGVDVNNSSSPRLEDYWPGGSTNYIKESNVEYMRYGGKEVEDKCQIAGNPTVAADPISKTIADYVMKAKKMQDNGIVPVLTLPLKLGGGPGAVAHHTAYAQQCATLVVEVNNALVSSSYAPVSNWAYSNEPEGSPHFYNGNNAAEQIHDYIQQCYNSVTAAWATYSASWGVANPRFWGPELEGYNNYGNLKLVAQLCGKYSLNSPGTPTINSILPYIDVFTFHYYPFGDEGMNMTQDPGGNFVQATRQNVVDVIRKPVAFANGSVNLTPIADQFYQLLGPVSGTTNGYITDWNNNNTKQITVAVTEANICHLHDVNSTSGVADAAPTATGTSANGFIAGQLWAELMGLSMEYGGGVNFWSVVEGTSSNSWANDIGYISRQTTNKRRSTYHHFKLIAENMTGYFVPGSYSQHTVTPAPTYTNGIKTFASMEDMNGVYILIMNQNDNPYDYHINFQGTSDVAGRITINYPSIKTSTIWTPSGSFLQSSYNSTVAIPARATILLQFDCHGNIIRITNYTEIDAINDNGPHLKVIGNIINNPDAIACSSGPNLLFGTLTSNTSFTLDTVFIENDVTLAPGVSLSFFNCLVVVATGKKIFTTHDNQITVKNSAIVGCEETFWGGIDMTGLNTPGESLIIEDSYFFNSYNPIKTYKIPYVYIKRSIFINGTTAIHLEEGQTFTVTENIIGNFEIYGISTKNTLGGFVSEINGNLVTEVVEGLHSDNDTHDNLKISCNDFRGYMDYGIRILNGTMANQGDATTGAGNEFYQKPNDANTMDYINKTGSSFDYYYGPSQALAFANSVANIPTYQSTNDAICLMPWKDHCVKLIVGMEKHKENKYPTPTVFPNPGSGKFNLKYTGSKEEFTLIVYDLMGRCISKQTVDFSKQEEYNFEIRERGLYLVSISNDRIQMTKKVIVE